MWSTAEEHHDFSWEPQPKAANLLSRLLKELTSECPVAKEFSARLKAETGTRLVDWVDHLRLPYDDAVAEDLIESDFTGQQHPGGEVYSHGLGLFPRIVIHRQPARVLALKVERLEDILPHWPDASAPSAPPESPLRWARLAAEGDIVLEAWQRHGRQGFELDQDEGWPTAEQLDRHRGRFAARQRDFADPQAGFDEAERLIDDAIAELGTDRACALFFAAERDYWQGRNRAAQVQKARQDALGLGWANHDHHTYRSSRLHFARLVSILQRLGFQCRERFYAGQEAGWGAQVLEQPAAGVVIFADVDLSPQEVAEDFAHQPLAPRDELGTVGLWCALHGEAFLQAGMHHLECQFNFEEARRQLAELGIACMDPFTDFTFLRQCFTQGEMWPVDPARVESLRRSGQISAEQAERFLREGALGSHLEILERNDGYKGFNQTGISRIIQQTDPRLDDG